MDRRQYLSGLVAAGGLAVTGVSTTAAQSSAIASWEDPQGDDAGPGNYTYPTSSEIPEGELDLASFTIGTDGDRYTFDFSFHSELTNNWDGANGFSHQVLQVYFKNPDGSGGSTEMRKGINATLESNYHHRLMVTPFPSEVPAVVEDASGNVVSEDVSISTTDASTIRVSIPQSVIGYLESASLVPIVAGWDGYGTGGIRALKESAGEWSFGGAKNDNAPVIIDLVTPEGTSQSDALSYSSDAKASVPYLSIGGSSDGGSSDGGSDDGSSDGGSSDDGGSDDGSSDDGSGSDDGGSSDDGSSDDGGSDDGSSDDSGSESSSDNDGSSDDGSSDSGLPGFGLGVGLVGAAGGALAARRRGEDEDDA
ncbi:C-terminal binding-module, SLH-like, of glucodextranase [Natronoarchaeum philippinense]|uniref:C-terminal binding-module, SLH-like, of glucodextranase n=1 Tax=Natronoarchaeum philippinense TaxID=558529 RepID=A0A285NZW1_NATPI|nr:glucodextranase DOMON-like domain-containing protein [Natronoarchaeum philippinense]SNZ15032.1 C-terminal binding-module, SLH-like, of glucodextranase [Natronoarchaeum philippinense]